MKTPELFRKGCILDRQKDAIAVSPFFAHLSAEIRSPQPHLVSHYDIWQFGQLLQALAIHHNKGEQKKRKKKKTATVVP
jgi:hypothetical protein